MKVRGFWPPKTSLIFHFLTVREYWIDIAKPKNVILFFAVQPHKAGLWVRFKGQKPQAFMIPIYSTVLPYYMMRRWD